jgi:hypothetical protein
MFDQGSFGGSGFDDEAVSHKALERFRPESRRFRAPDIFQ